MPGTTNFPSAPFSAEAYKLAEGPLWDAARQRLFWVDIDTGRVLSAAWASTGVRSDFEAKVDTTVGAAVLGRAGRLIVAGEHNVFLVDHEGARTTIVSLLSPDSRRRLNDAACDPAGRLLVGSMSLAGAVGQDELFRVDLDGSVEVLDSGLTLSNGLGWSPSRDLLYNVDSHAGLIWRRRYDAVSGWTGQREEFARVTDGSPDGLCVDTSGTVWVSVWGAGEVRGFTSSGHHVATVTVAAPHATSAAFAGPGLDRMVVTTARDDLTPEQLRSYPDSGRLFIASPGAVGQPPNYWGGQAPVAHR